MDTTRSNAWLPLSALGCGDDGAGCTYIGLEQKMNQIFISSFAGHF
jgi:hypothetical protein